MRTLILLGLLSTLLAASGALQIRHISLQVDHFNPLDRRMFDARYFENSEFYQPGGAIFSEIFIFLSRRPNKRRIGNYVDY